MRTKFFEKYPTSLRLEMFTVVNEGFQRWDPATRSAEANPTEHMGVHQQNASFLKARFSRLVLTA